jgi:hypothetical protein
MIAITVARVQRDDLCEGDECGGDTDEERDPIGPACAELAAPIKAVAATKYERAAGEATCTGLQLGADSFRENVSLRAVGSSSTQIFSWRSHRRRTRVISRHKLRHSATERTLHHKFACASFTPSLLLP